MKGAIRWIILGVAVLAIGAGVFLWRQRAGDAPQPPPVARQEPAAKPEAKPPAAHYPLPQVADAASLPALEQSDSSVRELLVSLFGRSAFDEFFSVQGVIRRIVATVDNLPREKVAQRLMPVRPAKGAFLVTGDGENLAISAGNSARYLPFVVLAESVDTGKLVAAYIQHYPLFQQAYKELGYPAEYFNNRLVQVIDHLIATPEVQGPVKLVQRKVLYEFADPELEAKSAGQKIMIRIGPENAARMKAKLADIRRAVTAQTPKTPKT